MSEQIVYLLEIIYIKEYKDGWLTTVYQLLCRIVEGPAVEQPRKRVMNGQLFELPVFFPVSCIHIYYEKYDHSQQESKEDEHIVPEGIHCCRQGISRNTDNNVPSRHIVYGSAELRIVDLAYFVGKRCTLNALDHAFVPLVIGFLVLLIYILHGKIGVRPASDGIPGRSHTQYHVCRFGVHKPYLYLVCQRFGVDDILKITQSVGYEHCSMSSPGVSE